MLADEAYDADRIPKLIQNQDTTPNMRPKSNWRWKPCFSNRPYHERNPSGGSSPSDGFLPLRAQPATSCGELLRLTVQMRCSSAHPKANGRAWRRGIAAARIPTPVRPCSPAGTIAGRAMTLLHL